MKMPPATRDSGVEDSPLVEVMDHLGRVLAAVPATEVRRQQLCHRSVAILLFDEAGRLFLRKRQSRRGQGPERWDVPARSPVFSGESLLDAATRALEATLGIHSERLRQVRVMEPSLENGNEFLHIFTLVRPEGSPGHGQQPGQQNGNGHLNGQHDEAGGYFFGPEELGCLLRDFSELVSARFLLLAQTLKLTKRERRPW
jgi:8-oxo-dGTP pyrophosphatase MutT (NUDIX family)